jgi:predicted NAD-dependent protein-ADP-ribosyltransferase YbiA (DUF1768 family)
MEEALWHKFTQHADLKAELLSTGNAELIEVRLAESFNQNNGNLDCAGI